MCPSSSQEDKEVFSEGQGSSLLHPPPPAITHFQAHIPWGWVLPFPPARVPCCPQAQQGERSADPGAVGAAVQNLEGGAGFTHDSPTPPPPAMYTGSTLEMTKPFISSHLVPTETHFTN